MIVRKLKLLCLGLIAAVAVGVHGGSVFTPAVAVAAPVPKPVEPAPDPLDRVKVEAWQLAALLRVENVRKDLGLTDEQSKKFDDARVEDEQSLQAALQQAVGGAVARGQAFQIPGATHETVEKAAKDVLKADQLRRLKQVSLQMTGPKVLLDRKVIRALGLTAAQEDKIEAAIHECPGAAENVDKAWAAALKILGPDQKGNWEKLTGKMLPAAELQKANAAVTTVLNLNGVLPPGVIPGGVLPPGGGAPPPAPEKE